MFLKASWTLSIQTNVHRFYSNDNSNFISYSPVSPPLALFGGNSRTMAKERWKFENPISQPSRIWYSTKLARGAWRSKYSILLVYSAVWLQDDLIWYLRKHFQCTRQNKCTWTIRCHANRYHHSDKVDWNIRRCLQKHQKWTYSMIVAFSEAWVVLFCSNTR